MSQLFRRFFAVAAAVAASLTAVPAAAASFALRPAVNYDPGGVAGQTLAVGDLNGDRRPDIVVGNLVSDDVSVLLSKPGGGFQPATRYPLNGGVGGVAIGDVNLDGRPDVAAGVGSAGVSVLHGDGAGGFASPETYPADGTSVHFVAIGDMNGDGRPDLAVISDKVMVLLQKADGDFGAPWSYDAGFIPDSLAIGDLNRDGRNDLAVASQDGASYLLGTGDRVFSPLGPPQPVSAPPLYWLRIADMNRDRRPDLVAADLGGANGVTVLRAASFGGYLAPQLVETERSVLSLAVADMDRDGRLDLVLGQTSPNTVGVMLKQDSGFSGPVETPIPDNPVALETADVNRDGLPDVVTANYDGQTVSVLLNASTPTAGLSVHALRFGRTQVGSRSASRTITVTNTGAARLRPSSVRMIGPDADEFRISGDGCTGESLPPGKACRVAVRFAPVTRGLGHAVLRIRSNDPASPAKVGLRGTGVRAP